MTYLLLGHISIAVALTILMTFLLTAGIVRRSISQLRLWMIVAFCGTLLSGVGLVIDGAQLGHVCLLMSVYSVLSLTVVRFYDSRVTALEK